MIDYSALRSEINTDPVGLGYSALVASGDHVALAGLLNAPRVGVTVNVGVVPAYKVVNAIVSGEWALLTTEQKRAVEFIVSAGEVDASDTNVRAVFAASFGAGTQTRANLLALGTRTGSRADELFGAGTVISSTDVGEALR